MATIQECQYRECQRVTTPWYTGVVQVIKYIRAIRKIGRRYVQWVELKHQQRQLMAMEDRMLKDIGLSRADAVRITTGTRFWPYMMGKTGGPPGGGESSR